jgi:hypothetical protein
MFEVFTLTHIKVSFLVQGQRKQHHCGASVNYHLYFQCANLKLRTVVVLLD